MSRKTAVWTFIALLVSVSVYALPTTLHFVAAVSPPPGEWSRTFGGSGNDGAYYVIQTVEGGYALAGFASSGGNNHDFCLIKADSSGVMQWNKTYGGNGIDDAYCVIETTDGGYALAGFTNSSVSAGNYDGWLVKTDSSGNMQWSKTYGGATADDLYNVIQVSDGYVLCGYTTSFGAGAADGRLIKVDSSGNLLWSQTYGGAGVDDIVSMTKTADGGYALVGYTRTFGSGGTDFWLLKVDSEGALQWNKTYGGTGDDSAHSVVQTSDGGCVLAGFTSSFGAGDRDFWLVKVDSEGTMQWNKTFGGSNTDDAISLAKTSDGFVLSGYTSSYGVGSNDIWVIKTDSLGNLVWSQTFGGSGADYAYSIIQTADGGYALAGYTASFGVSGTDCYFLKLTAESTNASPTGTPAASPTQSPTTNPTSPTYTPTSPTSRPTVPTNIPTDPTDSPSISPSPTPAVPEFPFLAFVIAMITIALMQIILKKHVTCSQVSVNNFGRYRKLFICTTMYF